MNGRFARLVTMLASGLQRVPAGTAAAAMLGGMLVMTVGFHFGITPAGFIWAGPR
jgi:hypothetical protein